MGSRNRPLAAAKTPPGLVCMCGVPPPVSSPSSDTTATSSVAGSTNSARNTTSTVAGSTGSTHATSSLVAGSTSSTHLASSLVAGSTSSTHATSSTVAGSTGSTHSAGNPVAGSTSPLAAAAGTATEALPPKSGNGVKCKMCRLKPKFGFLRSQRSLDSGPVATSPARVAAGVKEAEAARAAQPRARRARSAERYEGLRVNERSATSALPRQTSLQTPMMTSLAAGHVTTPPPPPPIISPPPSYELAVGQAGLPPSYDEYLSLRSSEKRNASPPPPWSLGNQAVATQTPARAASPAHICKCDDCQNLLRQICRQRPPPPAAPRQQLRVSLPPEAATTTRECTCSRCQPRPASYRDTANVNSAVLISLDTTTAMHGVLTDGIAFCSLM